MSTLLVAQVLPLLLGLLLSCFLSLDRFHPQLSLAGLEASFRLPKPLEKNPFLLF